MNRPTKDNPSIRWVKKASSWCVTYFEHNDKSNTWKQVQEWHSENPKTQQPT